jgi:hypothetical protein
VSKQQKRLILIVVIIACTALTDKLVFGGETPNLVIMNAGDKKIESIEFDPPYTYHPSSSTTDSITPVWNAGKRRLELKINIRAGLDEKDIATMFNQKYNYRFFWSNSPTHVNSKPAFMKFFITGKCHIMLNDGSPPIEFQLGIGYAVADVVGRDGYLYVLGFDEEEAAKFNSYFFVAVIGDWCCTIYNRKHSNNEKNPRNEFGIYLPVDYSEDSLEN